MKVEFIGLGVMGRPMAGHLIAAGHAVTLHRVKEPSRFLLEAGRQEAASPAEGAEAVVLMLSDTPDVEAGDLRRGGVAQGLAPGALLVDKLHLPRCHQGFRRASRGRRVSGSTRPSLGARPGLGTRP